MISRWRNSQTRFPAFNTRRSTSRLLAGAPRAWTRSLHAARRHKGTLTNTRAHRAPTKTNFPPQLSGCCDNESPIGLSMLLLVPLCRRFLQGRPYRADQQLEGPFPLDKNHLQAYMNNGLSCLENVPVALPVHEPGATASQQIHLSLD